jgi:hypothetical protein
MQFWLEHAAEQVPGHGKGEHISPPTQQIDLVDRRRSERKIEILDTELRLSA